MIFCILPCLFIAVLGPGRHQHVQQLLGTHVTSSGRLGLTARAFFLATVLGLALAFREPKVIQGLLFLVAIGALAMAAGTMTFLAERWICLIEGVLAAFVVGLALPAGVLLLPYLVVPALLAGVSSGAIAAIIVSGSEMLGLLVVLALGGSSVSMQNGIELAAPWAVASLGAGLTGTWVVQLRGGGRAFEGRTTRRTSRHVGSCRSCARSPGGCLRGWTRSPWQAGSWRASTKPSTTRDPRSSSAPRAVSSPRSATAASAPSRDSTPEGHIVQRCWDAAEPVHEPQASGLAERRWRVALPLRSGSRIIGVVVAESQSAPSPRTLEHLMTDLDEQSLKLDTALVFDEVRSLATLEERHGWPARSTTAWPRRSPRWATSSTTSAPPRSAEATSGPSCRRCAASSPGSSPSCGCRSSTCAARSTHAGLGAALSDYVRRSAPRSDLTVHLTLDEAPTRLRVEAETELLRIAQEAITNARKHADAENLWVPAGSTRRTPTSRRGRRRAGWAPRRRTASASRSCGSAPNGSAPQLDDRRNRPGGEGTAVAVTIGERRRTECRTRSRARVYETTFHAVLLVDDHELIRQGLRRAFERSATSTVVGEAGSVAEALRR